MTNYCIFCTYRAPAGNLEYFIEQLDCLFDFYLKSEIILCGDFNIDFSVNNHKKTQLENFLYSFNLIGTVYFPTRITSTTSSTIDNFFIGKHINYSISPYINGLSDHDGQLFILGDSMKRNKLKRYLYKRDINDMTIANFQYNLTMEGWNEIFEETDVNQMYNKFLNTYLRIFNFCFPLKMKYNNKKVANNWITKGILTSCKRKKELYLIYRSTNNARFSSYYKKYCSILSKVIIKAKTKYNNELIMNSNNKMRSLWNIVNKEKGNTKKKFAPTLIKDNNSIISSQKMIANLFNDHFTINPNSNNLNKLCIHNSYLHLKKHNPKPIPNIMWQYASTSEIEKIIRSLKQSNSSGYDGISSRILKLSLPFIISPITYIFNTALKLGVFPDRLKYAMVKPIFKKDDPQSILNYRPISLLTAFSKVLEKLIYERIVKHLTRNNLLISNQYGFRANHSTEQAIFTLLHSVLESMNKKQMVGGVFCDLQKAFDTVNHTILLKKIQFYGINGSINKIIQSYLTNRQQMVTLNGNFSTWKTVNCGVPQGSVLGPLLFLIYINDLPSGIDKMNSTVILYADDTSIILSESSPTAFNIHYNNIFSQINTWFRNNLLHLNLNKTQFMEFKTKSKLKVTENLDPTSNIHNPVVTTRFLGLIIDDTLTWQPYIESLLKRISKAIFVIRYLKHSLETETLKIVYFAYVHSLIRYGIIFWGNSSGAPRVFIMQKKILRIICNLKPRDTCRELFPQMQIMTFYSLYIYSLILFVINNGDLFQTNSVLHEYDTRIKDNLHFSELQMTKVKKGPYNSCIKAYNYLLNNITVLSPNSNTFKNDLKEFFIAHPFYSVEEYYEYKDKVGFTKSSY